MSDSHQENLRDLAAMFALFSVASKYPLDALEDKATQQHIGITAFELADAFLSAREPVIGIASAKRKRK